jgi:hypothetical protein
VRISTDVSSLSAKSASSSAAAAAPAGSTSSASSSSVYFLKKERGPLPAADIGQAVLVSSAVDSSPLNALYLFVHNIFMPQLRSPTYLLPARCFTCTHSASAHHLLLCGLWAVWLGVVVWWCGAEMTISSRKACKSHCWI